MACVYIYLVVFYFDALTFRKMFISFFQSFVLLSGSNVPYDDSMNLRNILWLAPFPGDSDESWVAPGNFTKITISV